MRLGQKHLPIKSVLVECLRTWLKPLTQITVVLTKATVAVTAQLQHSLVRGSSNQDASFHGMLASRLCLDFMGVICLCFHEAAYGLTLKTGSHINC